MLWLHAMPELIRIEPVQMGGIVEVVPMVARMQLIPAIFERLDDALDRANVFYAGPQTALYRIEGETMEVRVGVPLFQPIDGFEMFDAPGANALCQRITGPLEGLPGIYRALTDDMAARGLTRGTWAREVYRFIAKDAQLNVTDVSIDVTDQLH
jgi:effector-binding domain-containing protein